MNRSLIGLVTAFAAIAAPALADSINGGPNGVVVTSINDGPVTAVAAFGGRAVIAGGKGNLIGVSAIGAAVSIQILKELPDPSVPTNDSTITVGSIVARNTGPVTAVGTFNGSAIDGGNSNGMSVTAAGTSVNISITKR